MTDLIEVELLGDESHAELCVYKNDDLIAHYPVGLDDLAGLAKSAPEVLRARRGDRDPVLALRDEYSRQLRELKKVRSEAKFATPYSTGAGDQAERCIRDFIQDLNRVLGVPPETGL